MFDRKRVAKFLQNAQRRLQLGFKNIKFIYRLEDMRRLCKFDRHSECGKMNKRIGSENLTDRYFATILTNDSQEDA